MSHKLQAKIVCNILYLRYSTLIDRIEQLKVWLWLNMPALLAHLKKRE